VFVDPIQAHGYAPLEGRSNPVEPDAKGVFGDAQLMGQALPLLNLRSTPMLVILEDQIAAPRRHRCQASIQTLKL